MLNQDGCSRTILYLRAFGKKTPAFVLNTEVNP